MISMTTARIHALSMFYLVQRGLHVIFPIREKESKHLTEPDYLKLKSYYFINKVVS